MDTKVRARRRKDATPAQESSRYTVTVRYRAEGGIRSFGLTTDDKSFYPAVQRWRYVMANRQRITRETRNELRRDMASWMSRVCEVESGAFNEHIKEMTRSDVVEVSIPFEHEEMGWAARLFPWESAFALLTRDTPEEVAKFSVVRHLIVRGETRRSAPRAASLLAVRSAPGEIGKLWDLNLECDLVLDALRPALPGNATDSIYDPDRDALAAAVSAYSPAIIHLAAVDPYALEQQGLVTSVSDSTDGVVLRKAGSGFDLVSSGELAAILTCGKSKPVLVAITSCFSAPRAAALSVAYGSRYAIGFLDTVSDEDSMLFFGAFYRVWTRDWNILSAFRQARSEWIIPGTPQKVGVVLWSRESLLDDTASVSPARVASESGAPRPDSATVEDLKLHVALITDRSPAGAQTQVTSLNYSLLHNDRSPFRTFFIEKTKPGKLAPLQIEVALEVGGEPCRCRLSVELPSDAAPLELASRIKLPLVSGLLRQCTESLRTNLYIRVACGEKLLRETSERVTVLPADEWRDDGEDHRWLPSFVLPRDPAVLKVIDAAQRYLRTLLDDCSAGFDGYQQLDDRDNNAAAVVDPQVQAIWAALQHDLPVSYINPPPSYTSQSQRLRSPSEIFRGNAATCIDLALLFASCLEFIGIYPVVFLISGHAFPGYWRSDKAWWRMRQFRFNAENVVAAATRPISSSTSGQSEGWMFDGNDNLLELLRYVQEGALVPFESTFAATQRGFLSSLEEGSARLHPETFDAMIDIQSARDRGVTPLPLFDKFA